MRPSEPKKRKTRSSGTLKEKAGFTIALGALFLLLPLLNSSSPQADTLRRGLLLPGLLALAVGTVLLALDRWRQRRQTSAASTASQPSPPAGP